jgi:hypothetical protein
VPARPARNGPSRNPDHAAQAATGPRAADQPPGFRSGEGSASVLEHLVQDGRRKPGVVRPFTSRGKLPRHE